MLVKRKCLRCGHEWYPRKERPPMTCPKCKNRYWNRPRKTKKKEVIH